MSQGYTLMKWIGKGAGHAPPLLSDEITLNIVISGSCIDI